MCETSLTQTPVVQQQPPQPIKKSPVKQTVETPAPSTTTTLRRRSKTPDNTPDHHRVLSNIENKDSATVVLPNGKPNDNHFVKNKSLQSPVNRNKV